VEDVAENWQVLRHLLEHAGFQVRLAENGQEGIEVFQSWQPHFIWMDWRMPVMDGLETTRRIRRLPGGRSVKIVALSASVFKEEREQVLAAGADDFEPKPIQFDRFYDCLKKYLGVRFTFDEPPGPRAKKTSTDLDGSALARLPVALRTELAESLVSLDAGRIAASIRRVAEVDPTLGGVLEYHAGKLHYTPILQALQTCRGKGPAKGDS
jgi:CheY-like chemotaxis protein